MTIGGKPKQKEQGPSRGATGRPKRKAQGPPRGSLVAAKANIKAQAKLSLAEDVSRPIVLFSHGGGSGSSSSWIQKWEELLKVATDAVYVHSIGYPYMKPGKKQVVAPKVESLVAFHDKEMERLRARFPGRPVILAGKSIGSRVSCMVAGKEGTPVEAVVCLGYPLQGAKLSSVRDKPLIDLKVPVIFVQGSKDTTCSLKSLEEVRQKMSVQSSVHEVEDGDGSLTCELKKMKAKGIDQDAVDQQAADSIKSFIQSIVKAPN